MIRRNSLIALNIGLLILFPIAWAAPLMRAGILPIFGLSEISILSGIYGLWQSDPALAGLVALFALVAPYAKTLAMLGILTKRMSRHYLAPIKALGRLAMADIFLIALYIVIAKGTGVGRVETAWGLWVFSACVMLSLLSSWAMGTLRHSS
ncbi:MAG: paraquat-inducible protein A [Mangrovicoccus sp.]